MGACGRLGVIIMLLAVGCGRRGADEAADVQVKLTLEPDPPTVGLATAKLTLSDEAGKGIPGATLKLEGNMNHAGMKPVFADAKDLGEGRYQAELDFTMGGDWFILVTGKLPDGRALQRKIDVPGVRAR